MLNPTAIRIYLGVAGNSASATSGVPSVPPSGFLVLPIQTDDIELGATPADVADRFAKVIASPGQSR